ncbi:type IV pilus modification protein PilV [Verminephrobacter aporrectodeae subsp. tuberculatae]|uniref:Type IV pilus modification protein PilV n=1 Tax=Verminephrobacter aporrectodeae subsp. tuberculatae TaxID=1110392 RepID=A0ABT3KT50_9BURK|nr:type IV pilus modification protein PilV [Verminephrobacter aporrectodeae]MCW5257312.1 type IV pilus modification protein PilV [Verminephrobacter aporrectodeae subsp. tuberculatae]MCW5321503.1 type IV pilus modification protein PilV [Verminephrobacter aporrectodeae subsp. tuberculatae]
MTAFLTHPPRYKPAPKFAQGVTLIETLVAIVVLSIGLLGMAGLQAASTKYKINTWARSSASTLLSDLSERVRVNPDAAGGAAASNYVISDNWTTQQTAALTVEKNCATQACTASERATFDLLIWRERVRTSLPQGAALIEGDRSQGLTVTMMWFDKEQLGRTSPSDPLDLVAARTCSNTDKGMAQQTCCPAAAAAPAGVRCARFSFIP